MKKNTIEWLFFDIGSTLVDENRACLHRLHDLADAVSEPFEIIYEKFLKFNRANKKGDREVINEYGITNLIFHREEEELFPETVACLEELSKEYKIGVIANQSPGSEERLKNHGILKYIDLVIASAEEGVSKPDRRIFDIALSRAGCSPANAVMIGDRLDNDIAPAKKLGMKTVRVKQGYAKYWTVNSQDEQADYEVDDLSGIPAVIKNLDV